LQKEIRYHIFLKDTLLLAVTTFGGPQAHLSYFQKILVEKRRYLTEPELMEINSLCQVLPGPTSTQTLTAIGFKLGGPNLAYLTLLIWMLPAVALMTAAALFISSLGQKHMSMEFTRFIQPMAVGFVSYGAWMIAQKTVKTKTGIVLMAVAAITSYIFQTPFVFPAIILGAGFVTAFKFRRQPKEQKQKLKLDWSNFLLWAGVLIFAAALGGITKALPVKLFENFYRNGSLVFGGGQILAPLLYTEFVEATPSDSVKSKVSKLKLKIKKNYAPKPFHHRITSDEFLSGYAVAQALPGPVFSFSSYIGALSSRDYGVGGQLLGAIMSALGIFLPGTFLIFFVIRFWDTLKQYRPVRASLEGITAASSGLIATSAIILFQPLDDTVINFAIVIATFCILTFTKIPSPLIIIGGLILGFIIK
jgi:chromate transporter